MNEVKRMKETKAQVLGRLLQALHKLERSSSFAKLVPEVRVNLVYALPNAETPKDVAGIEGRITVVNDQPKASGSPQFGASDHMARAILQIQQYRPEIRSGINFRFNERIADIVKQYAEEKDLAFGYIDRRKEPEEVQTEEGKSMPWKMQYLTQQYGEIPTIFYESAGWGKEPLFVIIGEEPRTIVNHTISISQRFS